jgi:hypothetical protein
MEGLNVAPSPAKYRRVAKASSGQFPLPFWIRILFKELGCKEKQYSETGNSF